jgi:hypothetical protein
MMWSGHRTQGGGAAAGAGGRVCPAARAGVGDAGGAGAGQPGARAFPSLMRSVLTEICLCHACSCHEIEDGNARGSTRRPTARDRRRCPGARRLSVAGGGRQCARFCLTCARVLGCCCAGRGKHGTHLTPDRALALARDGELAELREMATAGVMGAGAGGQGGVGGAAVVGGGSIATLRDRHGSGALHWAAGGGHLVVCRWLVPSPRHNSRDRSSWIG